MEARAGVVPAFTLRDAVHCPAPGSRPIHLDSAGFARESGSLRRVDRLSGQFARPSALLAAHSTSGGFKAKMGAFASP
jgi:hypothetical protein